MSRKALEWAWDADLPHAEKFLLVALGLYADSNNQCYPMIEELMKKTALSKSTVQRGIKTLEKLGILTKNKKRKKGEKWYSNYYQLNTEKEIHQVSPRPVVTMTSGHHDTSLGVTMTPNSLYILAIVLVLLSSNKNLNPVIVFFYFVQFLDSKKIPEAAVDFDQSFELKNPVLEAPKIPHCPYQDIVGLYRKWLPMCPAVFSLSETRKKYMQARWREYPSLDNFDKFFKWVSKSRFLTGQVSGRQGGKPFVASLEWLMRPENFLKVLEHKYHE